MCLVEIAIISEDTYLGAWISRIRCGGRCPGWWVSDGASVHSYVLQESSRGKFIQRLLKGKNESSQNLKGK